MTKREGGWIQTYTGRQFWPMDPRPEEIDIKDIAHALSLQCRYAGHCKEFYSVAQHSYLVMWEGPWEFRREALLHDASEAYLMDVPRPVKKGLGGYSQAEARLEKAIAQKFGLKWPWPDEVKRVDNAILGDEAAQLLAPMLNTTITREEWGLTKPPLGITIVPWTPQEAERNFLDAFTVIMRS